MYIPTMLKAKNDELCSPLPLLSLLSSEKEQTQNIIKMADNLFRDWRRDDLVEEMTSEIGTEFPSKY